MANISVSIIVYQAEPLDYWWTRHTALWLQFSNGSPSTLVHIVGPTGGFSFEHREVLEPWQSQSFAKRVDVGVLSRPATAAQTIAALRSVPIRNDDREFDCQTWVTAALDMLRGYSLISNEMHAAGVDGMVDALYEARDTEG
ncbi:hypothetical protein HII31_13461 [Pseudocercospora fuligena]|uniref:Uncharacterized protein n=1 Tax=Pseudocercospora fuligena TaxID=685502 RepID=A0A8H6R5W9_9PEZI|nr:hypothetical protein HII31_13461 [Pseudocercospora fuligena]